MLDPRDAVDILEQACRGLDYAHRNGVVHRDVKPGNLLRSHEGVVKLADFGIAKAAEDSEITKAGSVLGTAAYLSPEQARGEKAGPPADLYALGVVSYQLLTGRLPYEAASLTDLARMQEAGPPLEPQRRRPRHPALARRGRDEGAAPAARGPLRGRARDGRRAEGRAARDRPGADRRHDGARPDLGDADARRDLRHPGPDRHLEPPRAAHARPAADRRAPAPPRAGPPRLGGAAGRAPPGRRASAATRSAASSCSWCSWRCWSPACSPTRRSRTTPTAPCSCARTSRGGVQDAVDEIKGLIEDNTQ